MPHVTNMWELFQSHKILLDTSFAMEPGFAGFINAFDFAFRRNPILVPAVVLWELRKLSRGSRPSVAARRAMKLIIQLYCQQHAEIRFEKCDRFQDLVIVRVTLQHQLSRNIAVLTCDRDLMLDLRHVWNCRSIQTDRNLEVLTFNRFTNRVCPFDDQSEA
jgi:rRNA-processing protein FCF1